VECDNKAMARSSIFLIPLSRIPTLGFRSASTLMRFRLKPSHPTTRTFRAVGQAHPLASKATTSLGADFLPSFSCFPGYRG
jgi:hypothetical protein